LPQSSPARDNPISGIDNTEGEVDVSLSPLKLDEKLRLLQGAKDLTPYQATKIVEDKDWKGEMFSHKDVWALLMKKDSTLYGETNYQFVRQPEHNLVNLDLIKMELNNRASKCKNPPSSKFHHGNGPFYIKCDEEFIGIYNKSEKEVVVLPYEQFGLPTGPFRFDLEDSFTHEILCRANLSVLVSRLEAMRRGVAPLALFADPKNAPFSFEKVS
jgi:hypothetical protein